MCVLHCSEGKRGVSITGLLAVESAHLVHSHQHPLRQRHWTKLKCWTRDNWLFGGKVQVVTPLAHLQNLPQMNWPRTHLNWCHLILPPRHYVSTISSDISRGCSNLGLLLGWFITQPLTRTVKCLLGRITSSLCNTGSKLSPKSEKWNAILSSSKWGPSKKEMADKVLFIAACHHIIAVTQVLLATLSRLNS